MNKPSSQWQTKERARIYSEGVRGAIPGAELQLKLISAIVRAWRPWPVRILDLGCGDGILGRLLMDEYPASQMIFADFSEPMLDKLRSRTGTNSRAEVINADFSTPAWTKAVESENAFDIIVSGFAIHHQPDTRKKALYAEVHELLDAGGVFLNLDQVRSASPGISEIFDGFFLDHILQFHAKAGLDVPMKAVEAAYYQDKKENIPAPVEAQCQWLRDTGFQEVDCFFKTFELALFGGRKAPGENPSTGAGNRRPVGPQD